MNWLQKQISKITLYMEEKLLIQRLNRYNNYMKYRLNVEVVELDDTYAKLYKVTYYVRAKTYNAHSSDIKTIICHIEKELVNSGFSLSI